MIYTTRLLLPLILLLSVLSGTAFAIGGEVFKINTNGVEYCGDGVFFRFNPKTDTDFWIRIESESALTLSTTPDFLPGFTVLLEGASYGTVGRNGAFSAGAFLANGGYVARGWRGRPPRPHAAVISTAAVIIGRSR